MKHTKETQNQENTILTLQLSKPHFDSLLFYIGCKNQSNIFVTTEEVLEDLSFCLSDEDKKLLLETKPQLVEFVKM